MKKKKLKKFFIFFCVSMIMLSTGCKKGAEFKDKKSKSIKIICEDTVFPLVNDLARDYNLNNEHAVTVESGEKESAFNKLDNSEGDVLIGYVQPDKKEIEADMLACDGIGIIVNASNKVDGVGTQELKKIYTGNIVNWEKLNGESKTIVPVAYKNMLNTAQQGFNIRIMDTPVKEQMGNSTQYVSSVEEMKNFVAQNKNSIGFIPGQWYNKESKFLKLNGIEITKSNLQNELYFLRIPIKMYYSKEKEDSLKDLFQYFKSEDGKKIIRKYCIEAF
ncbi:substrate-binding domain-containing protein [Clostridium sp. CF011]|uniref:substrate-binding domain-containing protein n=1 Tax=Clostridium sp. CF011 TaxID=2843318 RepID=UPI001C0AA2D4|nr:substrate-binding domain-containing protein [Clostridium sp. CF011]MBU3091957.1 substrate-binding domain-containing protein [Clostridium sp. CF011]WAG70472.1 substrate-binding domain-containing protein [Clostridium sp. CF011]